MKISSFCIREKYFVGLIDIESIERSAYHEFVQLFTTVAFNVSS